LCSLHTNVNPLMIINYIVTQVLCFLCICLSKLHGKLLFLAYRMNNKFPKTKIFHLARRAKVVWSRWKIKQMVLQIKLFQLPVLTNFHSDLGVFFQESYETVFGVHLITNFSLKNNVKMKVKELEKHFVLKMLSHSLIRIIAKSF